MNNVRQDKIRELLKLGCDTIETKYPSTEVTWDFTDNSQQVVLRVKINGDQCSFCGLLLINDTSPSFIFGLVISSNHLYVDDSDFIPLLIDHITTFIMNITKLGIYYCTSIDCVRNGNFFVNLLTCSEDELKYKLLQSIDPQEIIVIKLLIKKKKEYKHEVNFSLFN